MMMCWGRDDNVVVVHVVIVNHHNHPASHISDLNLRSTNHSHGLTGYGNGRLGVS